MDPDLVADVMVAASQDLPELVAGYLADAGPGGWLPVYRWLSGRAAGGPEERWGTVETVAALTLAVVAGLGGGAGEPPDLDALVAQVAEPSSDSAARAGIIDAYRLVWSGHEAGVELGDEWLVYADPAGCPPDRYTAMAGTLLTVLAQLIIAVGQHAGVDPVQVWRQVLPVGRRP